MSLNHALLSALAEKPGTGAELVKRFDQTYGHFWASTHQQIYRELKKLEADGWIATSPSDKKVGSVVYALRPAGRKALVSWTQEADSHAVARDPFLVRLRAMANVDAADPEAALQQARTRHLARLQHYEALHRKHFGTVSADTQADQAPITRANLLRQLVLDAGLRRERSQLEWCDASLQALRAWDEQAARGGAAKPEPELKRVKANKTFAGAATRTPNKPSHPSGSAPRAAASPSKRTAKRATASATTSTASPAKRSVSKARA